MISVVSCYVSDIIRRIQVHPKVTNDCLLWSLHEICLCRSSQHIITMMMSSNGNIFPVTGPLCGRIHQSSVNSPHQWREVLMFSLICAWINARVNNRWAGDLTCHRTHYDVMVMTLTSYDHDGVSNHQPQGCLLNRLFRRRSRKTSKLRVTGLCVENSPGPVNSLHKGPVTRKMFPFDDVIMCTNKISCNIFPHYWGSVAFTWEIFHNIAWAIILYVFENHTFKMTSTYPGPMS